MRPPAAVVVLLTIVSVACGPDAERARVSSDPVDPRTPARTPRETLALPNRPGSIRFAAIGDAGRGDKFQHQVAATMAAFREVFDFTFVIMLGDNVYDGGTPEDYRLKFELPYKMFLDDNVEFRAVIGNHDDSAQPSYPMFNMGGRRYYTFEPKTPLLGDLLRTRVRFFMLDTENLDRTQVTWLDDQMARSEATWEIPVFHRPIYTSGRYGSPARIYRRLLEPVFVRHGVRVALSGHEHFYERTHPQQGVTYFISGAAGSLRANDIRPTPITARGFDTDYSFLLFEIAGDTLFYQAIARTGHSVDAGAIIADTDRLR